MIRIPVLLALVLALLLATSTLGSPVAAQQISPEEAARQIQEQGFEVSMQGMAWSLNPPQADLLRLFLAAGMSVDDQIGLEGTDPVTPLRYVLGFACDSPETAEVVEVLLEAGADPNGTAHSGYTMLGAAYRCPRILEHLIAAGADVQQRDDNGHSAMYNAVVFGELDSVRVLVDAGFVPGDEYGELAEQARQDADKLALLEAANARGAVPPQAADSAGAAPAARSLEQAIDRRDLEAVREFLATEGPTAIDDEPPLVYLTGRCGPDEDPQTLVDLVQALLDAGAAVDEPEPLLSETPLYRAAWQCPLGVVETLLAAGADPNVHSDNDQTPLFQAVFTDKPDIVEALLNAGAKPDANTKFFAKSKPEIQALLKKKR